MSASGRKSLHTCGRFDRDFATATVCHKWPIGLSGRTDHVGKPDKKRTCAVFSGACTSDARAGENVIAETLPNPGVAQLIIDSGGKVRAVTQRYAEK